MKRNVTITILILLLITGGISYLIIWWRNRKNSVTGSVPVDEEYTVVKTQEQTQNVKVTTPQSKTEPFYVQGNYDWWINKLGHASFPLKYGSKGVEVLKMQETLNEKTQSKGLNISKIAEDGIWGPETTTRFNLLYPGITQVEKSMFSAEFDPMDEII